MLLLRIVALLTVMFIGGGILAYFFTADRRYLQIAGRVTKYALIFAFAVLALLLLERVIVL